MAAPFSLLQDPEITLLLERLRGRWSALWEKSLSEAPEALMEGILRIHEAQALETGPAAATPGTLLATSRQGLDIACGQGVLRLRMVHREGGRAITAADWLNARRDLARAD